MRKIIIMTIAIDIETDDNISETIKGLSEQLAYNIEPAKLFVISTKCYAAEKQMSLLDISRE